MVETAFIYKICVIGDASVGKSSTILRWSQDTFNEQYQVTVGVQHYTRNITVSSKGEEFVIKLIIWDMAGQEMFKHVRPIFYRASRGVILMFDITKPETFENLPTWVNEAVDNIGTKVPFLLVGNKSDLTPHRVDKSHALQYAEEIEGSFILSSAKTGDNVGDIFGQITTMILEYNSTEKTQNPSHTKSTWMR
ncbi:MAG: hypothetical protein BAJATHORv1_30229 [Candidatus Thorarchaeota archaeon]|nr:MAG: hypothetical protein BAJATHORv1_30229 [Candidatus Thorarchaeota archaeon]